MKNPLHSIFPGYDRYPVTPVDRDRGFVDRDRGYPERDRGYSDRDRDRGYIDRDPGYPNRDRTFVDRYGGPVKCSVNLDKFELLMGFFRVFLRMTPPVELVMIVGMAVHLRSLVAVIHHMKYRFVHRCRRAMIIQ